MHVVLPPDGPGASDAAQARRQVARMRRSADAPLAQVRALLAEIRAVLPSPAPTPAPPATSVVLEREAA
jgi:hypothetical protein